MENSEIIWTGSPDDQTCRINDYVLRVEEMYRNNWWWCIYWGDQRLDEGIKPSELIAKSSAINAINEHLKTR